MEKTKKIKEIYEKIISFEQELDCLKDNSDPITVIELAKKGINLKKELDSVPNVDHFDINLSRWVLQNWRVFKKIREFYDSSDMFEAIIDGIEKEGV